jgi:kynureninase
MTFENTKAFAQELDAKDNLHKYRAEFHFPKVNNKPGYLFYWKLFRIAAKTYQSYIDEVMDD